jgi:hypothetical protein
MGSRAASKSWSWEIDNQKDLQNAGQWAPREHGNNCDIPPTPNATYMSIISRLSLRMLATVFLISSYVPPGPKKDSSHLHWFQSGWGSNLMCFFFLTHFVLVVNHHFSSVPSLQPPGLLARWPPGFVVVGQIMLSKWLLKAIVRIIWL